METKLTKAPKWTDEVRSKLRATDSRVYESEIARGNATIGRRGFFGVLAGAVFAPYVCRNSGLLMPIADRSLVTYEVRGEKLAESGGPLPDLRDENHPLGLDFVPNPAEHWLQTMHFQVPKRSVNSHVWRDLYAAAKKARPEVHWSGMSILS